MLSKLKIYSYDKEQQEKDNKNLTRYDNNGEYLYNTVKGIYNNVLTLLQVTEHGQEPTFENMACFISSSYIGGYYFPNLDATLTTSNGKIYKFDCIGLVNNQLTPIFTELTTGELFQIDELITLICNKARTPDVYGNMYYLLEVPELSICQIASYISTHNNFMDVQHTVAGFGGYRGINQLKNILLKRADYKEVNNLYKLFNC